MVRLVLTLAPEFHAGGVRRKWQEMEHGAKAWQRSKSSFGRVGGVAHRAGHMQGSRSSKHQQSRPNARLSSLFLPASTQTHTTSSPPPVALPYLPSSSRLLSTCESHLKHPACNFCTYSRFHLISNPTQPSSPPGSRRTCHPHSFARSKHSASSLATSVSRSRRLVSFVLLFSHVFFCSRRHRPRPHNQPATD